MTLESFTIEGKIEGKLYSANLSDAEAKCEVIPASFKNAMDSIEKLQTYLYLH